MDDLNIPPHAPTPADKEVDSITSKSATSAATTSQLASSSLPASNVSAQSAPVVTEKATTTTTISPPFWQGILSDIHVNASGLLMFVCLSIGVAYPDLKPKCTEIAALAGTYLFASAKGK